MKWEIEVERLMKKKNLISEEAISRQIWRNAT